jgi:hypothetical protein
MARWSTERIVGLHEPRVNEHHVASTGLPADSRLRLLSFNIQVGISTERYRHYLPGVGNICCPTPGVPVTCRKSATC